MPEWRWPGTDGPYRADSGPVGGAGLAEPLVHNRGRVLADLARTIAYGAELISDLWVIATRTSPPGGSRSLG